MKHWYEIDESVEILANNSKDALKSVCRYKRITLWSRIKHFFKGGR